MASAVVRTLEDLKRSGGLQGKDIANIVEVSPATVSRWLSGSATPGLDTQTLIAHLRYIIDRLTDFYTPEETRLWLHSRNPLLNHERPIDLIRADKMQDVLAVIERLSASVYL